MITNTLSNTLAEALVRATDYHQRSGGGLPQTPGLTVAISREVGAHGTTIAREVGQRLGWPVYDEELLNLISRDMGTRVDMLKLIDEKPVSFLEQAVISLVSQYNLNQDTYMIHLIAAVRALAEQGHCVIVGRGAVFMLPPARTLRVRLIADAADRSARIKAGKGLSDKEAARWVEKTAQQRHTFVKKHFGKDVTESHHYDLILNTSRWTVAETAELIVAALQRLEARQGAAEQAAKESHALAGM